MNKSLRLVIFTVWLSSVVLVGCSNINSPTSKPSTSNTESYPKATKAPVKIFKNPNMIEPGEYSVNLDSEYSIKSGLYVGQAEGDSCYWERQGYDENDRAEIRAYVHSVGQFYIEVQDDDSLLITDCELTFLPTLPPPASRFPTNLARGTYLVGIDIQPGLYQGKVGDQCYWARLSNFTKDAYNNGQGNIGSITDADLIQTDGEEYYVQVQQDDFAFKTTCELKRIGD